MASADDLWEDDCPFCKIARQYTSFSPTQSIPAPTATSSSLPSNELAYIVLSTPDVLCFLDHMPISRGHVLLIPRSHRPKIDTVTVRESALLGAWLTILSRAVTRAVGELEGTGKAIEDWNIVQNNGIRASQVVFHSHFHVLPRTASIQELKGRSWTMFGKGQRGDLDEDDAVIVRDRIRLEIKREVETLSSADRRVLGIENESKL